MPHRLLLAITVSLGVLIGMRSARAEGAANGRAQLTVTVLVSRSCVVGAFDPRVSALPFGQARREAMQRAVQGSLESSCLLDDAPRVEVFDLRLERDTQRLEVQF